MQNLQRKSNHSAHSPVWWVKQASLASEGNSCWRHLQGNITPLNLVSIRGPGIGASCWRRSLITSFWIESNWNFANWFKSEIIRLNVQLTNHFLLFNYLRIINLLADNRCSINMMNYSYFRLLKRVLWDSVQSDRLTYLFIFMNHDVC